MSDNLTNKRRIELKNLTERDNLILARSDKDRAIVIWAMEEYI